jgi:hypothetical protein
MDQFDQKWGIFGMKAAFENFFFKDIGSKLFESSIVITSIRRVKGES